MTPPMYTGSCHCGAVRMTGHPEATAEYIQGDKTLR